MFDLGKHLKHLREERNLTQEELGNTIGSSERTIQNYEGNLRKPNFDMLIRLADEFDISIDYLVGRTDDPKRHFLKS